MTRKTKRALVAAPTAQSVLAEQLLTLSADPRKRRFFAAVAMTLPLLAPDDMDRIEPALIAVIGRHVLKRQAGE